MKLTLWWYKLSDGNWGFPYHWIRMVAIMSLLFGAFGVDKIYVAWAVPVLFAYAFIEGMVQLKGGSKTKELQDLLADMHGIIFSLYVFQLDVFPTHWVFWVITLAMFAVLHLTTVYED